MIFNPRPVVNNLPKIVWIVIDGLPYDMVIKYIHQFGPDSLKWFNKYFKKGLIYPITPLYPNCQTPPSLFSMWSGLPVKEHGLYGYDNPQLKNNDFLKYINGFDDYDKYSPLVWDLYLFKQKKVRLSSVPFVNENQNENLLSHTKAYNNKNIKPFYIEEGQAYTISPLSITISFLVNDQNINISISYKNKHVDKLNLLKESDGWHHYSLNKIVQGDKLGKNEKISFKVIKIRNKYIFLCLGYNYLYVVGSKKEEFLLANKDKYYNVQTLCSLYRNNVLGNKLNEGGNGEAERILIESLKLSHQCIKDEILWKVKQDDFDLFVGYYSLIDLISHELLGMAIDNNGLIDNGLQIKIDNIIFTVLSCVDELMCEIEVLLADNYKLVVNSDHGMLPIKYEIYPNTIFKKNGWLFQRKDGQIDILKSLCFFHPAENGLVVLNKEIMDEKDINEEMTIKAINDALKIYSDIGECKFIIHAMPVKSEKFITMYFLQPPKYARAKSDISSKIINYSRKTGDHTTFSLSSELRGVFIDPSGKFGNGISQDNNIVMTDLLAIALS